jgi:CRISPR/Cas system endoribonuclease Cas6 (RAMP superfamily)
MGAPPLIQSLNCIRLKDDRRMMAPLQGFAPPLRTYTAKMGGHATVRFPVPILGADAVD